MVAKDTLYTIACMVCEQIFLRSRIDDTVAVTQLPDLTMGLQECLSFLLYSSFLKEPYDTE